MAARQSRVAHRGRAAGFFQAQAAGQLQVGCQQPGLPAAKGGFPVGGELAEEVVARVEVGLCAGARGVETVGWRMAIGLAIGWAICLTIGMAAGSQGTGLKGFTPQR